METPIHSIVPSSEAVANFAVMERAAAQDWLEAYVAAWKSGDEKEIGALFSSDVEYRYHPADEPIVGRDAVIASWCDDPDEPGTFDARYEVFAVDGDRVVATGWSSYFEDAGHAIERAVYDNCFLIEYDEEGRCRRFTEFFRSR